jgi:hypothetical protein
MKGIAEFGLKGWDCAFTGSHYFFFFWTSESCIQQIFFSSMAKNRSSAVGRSSKPKPQTKSRPSGLSSNKARSKKSRETVKYGQLSRKEKTNLEEYGELTPRDLDEEEEDEEIEGQ